MTLGAAVAEVVAGRKLGNKAMLWGALAGTIPDLDIISNLWMNDIEGIAFHRGISHSIVFTVLVSFLFAWLARTYYDRIDHHKPVHQWIFRVLWIILGSALVVGPLYLTIQQSGQWLTMLVFLACAGLGGYWIYGAFQKDKIPFEPISYKRWYWLFFWCFATHIMIDAFTTYGTQIFQPFSNVRVTTSSISVVDPLYTLPLLIGTVVASFFNRLSKSRRTWLNTGLILSTGYMLFTFGLKFHVDKAFNNRMSTLGEPMIQYQTNPTIFNSILWHGVAELEDVYVEGYYSLFDKKSPFEELRRIPKRRDVEQRSGCLDSETLRTLKWFSDGFYNYSIREGQLYYNDLRFGTLWLDDARTEGKTVFYFRIDDHCDGHEIRETDKIGEAFDLLLTRIKGE